MRMDEWTYPLEMVKYGSNLDQEMNTFFDVVDGKGRNCFRVRLQGRDRQSHESLEMEVVPAIVGMLNDRADWKGLKERAGLTDMKPGPVMVKMPDAGGLDMGMMDDIMPSEVITLIARIGDTHKDRGAKKGLTWPMVEKIMREMWEAAGDEDKMFLPMEEEVTTNA